MPAISLIQTGQQSIAAAATATTFTESITAVDTSRAIIMCMSKSEDDSSAGRDSRHVWAPHFSASNQITFTRGSGSTFTNPHDIEWSVVEFGSGALQSLQAGNVDCTATTTLVSITQVATGRAFPILNFYTTIDNSAARSAVIPDFPASATGEQLRLSMDSALTTGQQNIRWQVVEFKASDATVQFATISVSGTATVANATVTAVDDDQTFIAAFFTGGNTAEQQDKALIYLQSTTNVRMERTFGNTESLRASVFVVEMTDGSRVERGTLSVTGSATVPGTQPSWTGAMTNGVVFSAWNQPQACGLNGTADARADTVYFTATLDSPQDSVTVQRRWGTSTEGDDSPGSSMFWQVVEWAAAAGGYTKAGSLVDGGRIKYLTNGGLVR